MSVPMTSFSRVTLVGERQRVDAVLPSEEPIGKLLPDVLRLVGDSVESPPRLRHLVTPDGGVLGWESSLAAAGIPDGTVITLVRAEDAPPAPVVHDVTEDTAEDIDLRAWRWSRGAMRWTATVAVAAGLLAAGLLVRSATEAGLAVALLALAAVATAAGGGLLGRFVHEPVGTALTLGGGILGILAVWAAVDENGWAEWVRWGGVSIAAAIVLGLLGVCSPLGLGGVIGAAFTFVLGGAWAVGAALEPVEPRLAAMTTVGTVVFLGLLPRLAITLSGLASLDDRRTTGAVVSRYDVRTALAATHRGLVTATVATAVSAAVAGVLLARTPNRWTAPLALLLALVLASRSRTFPLVAQVVALQAAAAVVLLVLLLEWVARTPGPPYGPLGAVVAATALPLAVLAVDPPEHVRVRLRRVTDRIEAAALIAVIPVAIGVYGTYGRLLNLLT
jgi:type VII secretion integral membrane protein EccD